MQLRLSINAVEKSQQPVLLIIYSPQSQRRIFIREILFLLDAAEGDNGFNNDKR